MAGEKKTYEITEAQLKTLVKDASAAAVKAYKHENETSAKKKVDRMLYKTKTLLEKYRYLTEYAKNSVYTLEQAEKVDPDLTDIDVLTKFGIFDDDKTLHRLKRGVVTVKMIMAHVDKMLEIYQKDCEASSSRTRQRQYRVIYYMYLAENRMTTREIADMEHEEIRTIQNDAKAAREDLTALIFGIDGILIRILKEQ
mgnify:CR=1 FL=1